MEPLAAAVSTAGLPPAARRKVSLDRYVMACLAHPELSPKHNRRLFLLRPWVHSSLTTASLLFVLPNSCEWDPASFFVKWLGVSMVKQDFPARSTFLEYQGESYSSVLLRTPFHFKEFSANTPRHANIAFNRR